MLTVGLQWVNGEILGHTLFDFKEPIIRLRVGKKTVPQVRRLSSLGKPRGVKRRPLGRIFLSYPHTNNRLLYYLLLSCGC